MNVFDWIIRRPVTVLVVIGVITVVLGWAALSLEFSTDLQALLPANDASVLDYVEVSRSYGSQDFLLVAVHDEDTVFNPRTLQKIWTLTEQLQQLPPEWVEEVRSFFNAEVVQGTADAIEVKRAAGTLPQTPEEIEAFRQKILSERLLKRLLLSEDEKTTLIILEERPEIINSDEAYRMTEAVERLVAPYQGPEQIYLSGGPYIMAQVRKAMLRDLKTLIPISIVVLLVVLYFSFRQLRGMLLPISVALISVVWTLGVMALVGYEMTMVSVVIPVILIAIADADSIHLITRYQETLQRGATRREAVLEAMGHLSQPVVFTSFSSAAGFIGLATAYSVIVKEFGIATAVGILFAMIVSLTFLPAMLVLLPARSSPHLARRPSMLAGRWRLENPRQNLRWVVGAALVFLLSIYGISQIEINNNPLDYVRPDLPVVRSARFIEDTFGGSLTLRVSLDTAEPDRWKDPAWLERVQAFQDYVEALPHTGVSTSIVDVVREINTSLHEDDPAYDAVPGNIREVAQSLLLFEFGGGGGLSNLVTPDYAEGQVTISMRSLPLNQLTPLVDDIKAYLNENFSDVTYRMTGQPMFGLRVGETLIPSQINSLMLSLLLVWGMLLLLTRSLRLSLISVVPLVFSIAAMLGVMGFFGIEMDIGTVMVASVAIGIGIDFAIHYISQYQQARKTQAPEKAVYHAMIVTWRALLYNTLSLGLGFSVMLFSQFKANIAFGALMGLTVALAFVATLRLVPALLLLTSKEKAVPQAVLNSDAEVG